MSDQILALWTSPCGRSGSLYFDNEMEAVDFIRHALVEDYNWTWDVWTVGQDNKPNYLINTYTDDSFCDEDSCPRCGRAWDDEGTSVCPCEGGAS